MTSIKSTKTVPASGGLRYKSKPSGSAFACASGRVADQLSCFGCGLHKPRVEGLFKRLIGKNQFFCSDVCVSKIFKKKPTV